MKQRTVTIDEGNLVEGKMYDECTGEGCLLGLVAIELGIPVEEVGADDRYSYGTPECQTQLGIDALAAERIATFFDNGWEEARGGYIQEGRKNMRSALDLLKSEAGVTVAWTRDGKPSGVA